MPGLVTVDAKGKKRKRAEDAPLEGLKPKAKKKSESKDSEGRLLLLETQIRESREHYGNIDSLLALCRSKKSETTSITAAVALCRVFCRLMARDKMVPVKGLTADELEDVSWLKIKFKEYIGALCDMIVGERGSIQGTALTLAMRIVKEETSQDGQRAEQAWRTGAFFQLVQALALATDSEDQAADFVSTYVEEHDDVRFFTFHAVTTILSQTRTSSPIAGSLALLSQIEGIPESEDQLEDWYGKEPKQAKHQLRSLAAHKKQAQSAWLAVLQGILSKEQRKSILRMFTNRIVPWFNKAEVLMDFLTDSYNAGGATSLLALSGLFYLIQEKNLDYPQFYLKLYSLLDDSIFHSKHRSRFFHLLDTFMSSTHLPAALVASFIKRLSRLALQAPPGGIVVIVPWIYNMLKKHPTCTFMIHRETRNSAAKQTLEDEGMDDPFDMQQQDPMKTKAIDSSLWEIETLQSHYHPNVATLAKIISEQFTKRDYNLEDFLDHSYQGIIEAELGRELKKAPVVEYEIPKTIITTDDGRLNRVGTLLDSVISVM